ncbi:hypothetical protein H0E87_022991 [Populus deltoides]|uniref:Uncharacterized protein n=1 Tax=Populus deltoides TaxID=3696 RepID=A0A8T2XEU4_POPDE|nr:hypothetical protein H0E87_022991 [Populus deltoides]
MAGWDDAKLEAGKRRAAKIIEDSIVPARDCNEDDDSDGELESRTSTFAKKRPGPQERGFLRLSAALLSSPILRSEAVDAMDTFVDIASTIGAILLSLLMCRSGLIFLLNYPELCTTLIDALRGVGGMNREECVPLRYASVLLSKGFVCSPHEVGVIVETHLRVVNAIDRLLISTSHPEEFLWVLWELCGLSRSDCGRQALLVLGYFPEAISILIEALHSVKESEPVASGASPINLAIFHSAAEIFEVIVTDSTASSLDSWIGHAMELHKALHSSSPGSNRKDTPARLLEWFDAGVVYHKNGAIGLLRYSAVLASGGDAHLTSTSILVADLTDVEQVVGDSLGGSDINVMDNLGKLISDKSFEDNPLRDSSITQMTTAIRILAFVSENSTVAAALYDEGALIVIHAILIKCSLMLERSSNSYDYLVDEGTERNSTSDLLLERNREQSLVDLLVPSLVLLINLLQKLQEAKEQHRNTKLMNALLRLHREVSPKLAASAADLSSPYPDSALGFGAVCHLVVSALACWPLYGWTPGLFHSLLANVQATSLLALGPKETCSLPCLLVLVVIQDMLRVFIIRIACQKIEYASLLLQPILCCIRNHLSDLTSPSEIDAYKVYRYLDFLAYQLVQRFTDAYWNIHVQRFVTSVELLLEEGIAEMLTQVLERYLVAIGSDGKQISDSKISAKSGFSLISWCCPVFKSFPLLCVPRTPLPYPVRHDLHSSASLSAKDCSLILSYLLKFCQVLLVGKELLSCLAFFKDLGSCNEGQSACVTTLHHINTSIEEHESGKGQEMNGNYNLDDIEWRKHPPLLSCWIRLLGSVDSKDDASICALEAVTTLSIGALSFCVDSKW